jgi:hypothetical protein
MRNVAWFLAALAFLCGGQARAAFVSNLSTGADPVTGALLSAGSTDSKYILTGPGGVSFTPQVRTQDMLPNTYLGDNAMPGSRWDYILFSPNDNSFVPSGDYVFQTTVNLTGVDAATAQISGLQVSTDNGFLSVIVNGETVFSHDPGSTPEEFTSILTIGDVGRGSFHSGLNTVEFTIINYGFGFGTGPSPAAFRAVATVDASPVPAPPGVILVAVGALCLAGHAYRRPRARLVTDSAPSDKS